MRDKMDKCGNTLHYFKTKESGQACECGEMFMGQIMHPERITKGINFKFSDDFADYSYETKGDLKAN